MGLAVAAAIAASPAADRRVLVDAYTQLTVSDRSVKSSRAGSAPRCAPRSAPPTRCSRDLAAAGARVRVTNPVGPLGIYYPARNHKKLIVADDVAYIGGINFSDHNFAWRDFMLRIDGGRGGGLPRSRLRGHVRQRVRPGRISRTGN